MADTVTTGGVNKMVAMIAGIVLVLVGILGFVMDPVLGVFEVNVVHNVVHLLSGAVLLFAALTNNGANARMALLIVGGVYALVTVLGFVAPALTESVLMGSATNAATNMADNILHLLLAIVFIAVPLLVKEETVRPISGRPQM
ncbi:MAG TPA: DUF4383 domain-containing protein [Candidatus Thermoplasmatota archaeon]|nr:DUF4383 domain-containing protein [Candidatus Thermoplasmatota archaeon]